MAPRFVANPPGRREVEVNPGTKPKLRCQVEAYPEASIDWTKNNRPLEYNREGVFKEGFNLKFNNVQAKDQGQYTCRVYNSYGSVNFTYTVIVTGWYITHLRWPPSFVA